MAAAAMMRAAANNHMICGSRFATARRHVPRARGQPPARAAMAAAMRRAGARGGLLRACQQQRGADGRARGLRRAAQTRAAISSSSTATTSHSAEACAGSVVTAQVWRAGSSMSADASEASTRWAAHSRAHGGSR
ncbi:hypothetical protein Dimus_005226, partial [Dionaea muscipula]